MTTSEAIRSTVADIDLDAIASNVQAIRARAKADVIAVVKADGYGHGAQAVAEACFEAGAVMVAVAEVEEGLAPREGGVNGPILVFLGATDSEPGNGRGQFESFGEVLTAIGDRPGLVHAAGSAGVAAFGPLEGMTAVRTGLSIYRLHAAPHLDGGLTLRPALSWRSRIHRMASVPAGTGVSYGHEYRLPRDGHIGTV